MSVQTGVSLDEVPTFPAAARCSAGARVHLVVTSAVEASSSRPSASAREGDSLLPR